MLILGTRFFVQHYILEPEPVDPTGPAACSGWDCMPPLKDHPDLKQRRVGLIDKDTPKSVYTKKASDGKNWKLVFSDEFNEDGRTFYPGEDPYWEAVDIWYGATMDSEVRRKFNLDNNVIPTREANIYIPALVVV